MLHRVAAGTAHSRRNILVLQINRCKLMLIMKKQLLLLLVGAFGCLFPTVNAVFAQTWTQTSAPTNRWWSVTSSADGAKLVAVTSLSIYTSTNAGTTWMSNSAPGLQWQAVASSADGSKLVAVAWKNGPIYTSTNSGATWTVTSAPNNYWSSVASSADGTKLVAATTDGGDIRIYISTDSGNTWTASSAPNGWWTSVASSADGVKLVAASRVFSPYSGWIYTSTNSGVTWTPSAGRPVRIGIRLPPRRMASNWWR